MTDLVTCTSFTPIDRNTLKGFADLYFVKMRMTISDVMMHEKDGKKWVSFPSMPMIDRDGNVMKDSVGKTRYKKPVISFDDDVKDRLRDAAIEAIETFRAK